MEKEIWKDIKGYEGFYQVSNMGRIRSIDGVTRKPVKYGLYLTIQLSKNGTEKLFYIHRLVALTFISNPLNKKEVNHIDGNKLNNMVKNLEWVTRRENAIHSIKNGLQTKDQLAYAVNRMRETNIKKVYQYKNGKYIAAYPSVRDLCRKFGYSVSAISECARGKCKTMYGYEWRYAE